jgi:hypothetical protein
MPQSQHDPLVDEFACPLCRARADVAWAAAEEQRRLGVEQLTRRDNLYRALARIAREHAEISRRQRPGDL